MLLVSGKINAYSASRRIMRLMPVFKRDGLRDALIDALKIFALFKFQEELSRNSLKSENENKNVEELNKNKNKSNKVGNEVRYGNWKSYYLSLSGDLGDEANLIPILAFPL